jgi:iron complex transport system substrate-binding protein
MRIVSLLPSATEMICRLGLREYLVGVTHECDFPGSVMLLPRVTRTTIPADATSAQIDELVRQRASGKLPLYELNVPLLTELRPDLIVTQALCDVCAVSESDVRAAAAAMPWKPRVLILSPNFLAGVFEAMRDVARAAGIADEGNAVIGELTGRVQSVVARHPNDPPRPTVVFLEWIDPLFCGGHWNPELVRLAGGEELIGKARVPSRPMEWREVVDADPDILFIACCGFTEARSRADLPLLERKPGWADLKAVRYDRVYFADGSAYFNRPGPRLVDSLEILAEAIHGTRTHDA